MKSDIIELCGETLESVEVRGDVFIVFRCKSGNTYFMYHEQDADETFEIAEIEGDFDSLIGEPIEFADEIFDKKGYMEMIEEQGAGVLTGTRSYVMYAIGTRNSEVKIRWYGESPGYFAKGITFELAENIGNINLDSFLNNNQTV